MAGPSPWIRHVEYFVDSSRSSEQQKAGVNAIAELVMNDTLTIEGLIKELELYLTTTDSAIRARGILFLSEILAQLMSKPLHHTIVHHLIGFFTSRLADWQALHGALSGCLMLLKRKEDAGAVMGEDALVLAQSFLENVQVQSLTLHDRKLCFELYRCLLDMHPQDVATLGEDLVHGICAAIDQEKDPQCLMDAFHVVKALGQLYPDPSGPVGSYSGELFEVLSCYFPVYFTHLKEEDAGVKRDELSQALMHAFCASPYFEEFAIPLLLDKLSSSLHSAKLDSLKYLGSCIKCYGESRMSKHAKAIWLSLKDVIFHFLRNDSSVFPSKPLEENDSLSCQIAEESLTCLRAAISVFTNSGNNSFMSLILNDEDVEMGFFSGTDESQQRVIAVGNILSELVKVSSSSCDKVIKKYFPQLMDLLRINPSGSCSSSEMANDGALYLSVELLSSCRDLAVRATLSTECCSLLQNFSTSLAHSFFLLLKSLTLREEHDGTSLFGNHIITVAIPLTVKGLTIFATFPNHSLQLSRSTFKEILTNIMSIVLRDYEKSLWRASLEALSQIGMFVGESDDTDKRTSYETIVLEKILSLLWTDNSMIPFELKLDAVHSVGSGAADFMMRVIHELEQAIFSRFSEIYIMGELKNRKTFILLLNFYAGKLLPWIKRTERVEEVGMRFIECIWNQFEKNLDFKVDSREVDVSNALMMTIKLIVSDFGVQHQILIVQKTCSILSSMKLIPSEQLSFSSIRESLRLPRQHVLFISLSASVLVALHPQTLIPDPSLMMRFLMLNLLRGCIAAAEALGSLLNKWSSTGSTDPTVMTLDEALDFSLDRGLLEICDPSLHETRILINGIMGLAWTGKGLLMRGHERVERVTCLLLKCLNSATSPEENTSGQDGSFLVARSAADAFHVLLGNSEGCLNKRFHATVRPLHKQRFFSAVLPVLLPMIRNATSDITRANLFRAFAHIVSNTPLTAVVNESRKVFSFVLEALSFLSPESQNKDLVYALLLVVSGIITVDNGRDAALENASATVNCLIGLISYPHMMLVRETAVQCLMATSDLPHARIYPFRPQVLRALSRALDDVKRPVRLEAVKCRQAWASMASS